MPVSLDNIQQLTFEITSHCNIRCPQCSRVSPTGGLAEFIELKHWDLDQILPNLELDQMPSLKRVVFEGDNGVAVMHPKITKLLDVIMTTPSQPNVLIVTNGSMRKPHWWHALGARYKNRLRVQFSIDGLADTNPLYRVDVDHQRVLDNAKAFIDGGGEGTQRCLVFKHNQHQLADVVAQAKEIGMHALIFKHGDDRYQGMSQWAVYDRNLNITHHIAPSDGLPLHQFNYDNTKNAHRRLMPSAKDEICPEWKNGVIAITYKGHIIPCCMYHADLYFNHPKNDYFRNLAGPRDLFDVNLKKLSDILDPLIFYGQRLTQSLIQKQAPKACGIRCPTIAGKHRTWSIQQI